VRRAATRCPGQIPTSDPPPGIRTDSPSRAQQLTRTGPTAGRPLRLQHLKVLAYVEIAARLGSIRKAAEQLNIASTAVNRSIIAMEEELEAELFERLPRGVRLTAAGELFVAHARSTMLDFDRLQSEIDALRGLRRGLVRVAAIEAVSSGLLPDILAHFQKLHPRVQVRARIEGTDKAIAALLEDDVEVAFAHNFASNAEVIVVARVQEPMFALVRRNHPLARKKSLRLHDCMDYPLVFSEGALGGSSMVERAFRRGQLRIVPALISNSFGLMESYCRRTLAVSFQIRVAAQRPELKNHLVAIPLQERDLKADLGICIRRGRRLPIAAETFVEIARQHFDGLK
jgi:DNA-binding transcriptional LysR family regulator